MAKGVVWDAGHGGKDPGGGSNEFFKEKDWALRISLYLHMRYLELGGISYLTRAIDEYVSLFDRSNFIKTCGASICISSHVNACGADGAETIHSIYNNGKLAQAILDEIKAEGQNIRRRFSRQSGKYPGKDYYYLHRNTGAVQTIIVEYGFADSRKDDVEQLRKDWVRYAEAVLRAVCEATDVTYNLPEAYLRLSGGVVDSAEIYALEVRNRELEEGMKQIKGVISNVEIR